MNASADADAEARELCAVCCVLCAMCVRAAGRRLPRSVPSGREREKATKPKPQLRGGGEAPTPTPDDRQLGRPAVYETSSYERPTDGPGPAPTDGAGVLSSVTGPRGAGDAIASDMRQNDKQRATKRPMAPKRGH
eukprot:scaffold7832_cov106-Isochrysis_galbana.AAC.8